MYNIVKNIFISTLLFSALYGNGIKTFFKAPVPVSSAEKLPLIYDSGYNISFFGVEKLHPFDSQKYGRIFELLKKRLNLTSNCYYMPGIVSDEQLLKVHSADYLASLRSSAVVARIAEIPLLSFVPNFLLQRNLLTPMKRATAGRLLGARLALKHGWAINLSGGYHHAKKDSGSGFCFYADIPLAIHTLWEENPSLKVMIIDLDAHQGNGFESILKDDKRISIFDMYNFENYPMDFEAGKYIRFRIACPWELTLQTTYRYSN